MNVHNSFKSFYDALEKPEREDLAERAKTSIAYLWQVANGHRKAGASVSARLKAADNRITDSMLRPDLYDIPQQAA